MAKKINTTKLLPNRISDEKYISKPKMEDINKLYKFAVVEIKKFNYSKLMNKKYNEILQTNGYVIHSNLWTDILTDFLALLLKREFTYEGVLELTQSLLPLYLLRVLTYFEEINNKSALEVDMIIKKQKKLTRAMLLNKLNI